MALSAFLMAGLVGTMCISPAAADTKYKACSRLTTAELGTALKPPISKVQDGDTVVDSGPYKGATVSSCTWRSGLNLVILRIWPAPTTKRPKGSKPLTVAEMARLGGKTHMAKLTPEERAKLGRQAAAARWEREKAKKKRQTNES